jgi:VanZ family protein
MSTTTRSMEPARYRGSLVVWLLLLAYASLYPLFPLRAPAGDALGAFFSRPRFITDFDIALNIVAYIPLGMLGCLHFQSGSKVGAIARATALGFAFSFAMECAQLFIATRVASMYDVLSNAGGALVGALVFADPWYSVVTRPLGQLREREIIAGQWGDAGLVLAMLWLIAQLNPALPFFGAGNIVTGLDDSTTAAAILQWCGVALSICGFGLFVSALLRGPQGTLRVTLVLLSIALWLKFVAASFMLQPHFAEEWLSAGRIMGLVAGICALYPLRRLPLAVRIYLALLAILAGALFSKIFGAYNALDEWLKLFRWPHGQLASFATLTQFLHEAWPFLAIVFLIALFFHVRRDPSAAA